MRRIVLALAIVSAAGRVVSAQTVKPGLEGKWEGTLGGQLRLVLELTRASDGVYLGSMTSVDQGNAKFPVDRVSQSGDSIVLVLGAVSGRYTALPSADGTRLNGTWTQNAGAQPLNFTRVGAAPQPTASAPAAAPARSSSAAPLGVDVSVPIAPTPAFGPGKTFLAYELNITNLSGLPMLLTRIEVLGGGKTLATFEGGDLNSILLQLKAMPVADQRSLDAAARTTAFLWVAIDSGTPMPTSIRHRITAGSAVVQTDAMPISTAKPFVIGPPLHGSGWVAANGPSNTSGHRRALIAIAGHGDIAQRFAIDWVKTNGAGTFSGDQLNNKSYFAYGNDAIAVLDGIVVETKDSIPENVPGRTSRAVPITLETIGGNHVIVDLGNGHYAFYAHLQPGSLRVKVGDRVKRGQVLGLVGNSGNSTEPHLHFHITNGASPLGAEGIPYVIDAWDEQTVAGVWTPRRNLLPLQNAFVRFP